jgi:hypothetical protein
MELRSPNLAATFANAPAIAAHPEDFQDTLAQLPGKREAINLK